MRVEAAASVITSWLAAGLAAMFTSAAMAEIRHVSHAPPAIGDKPGDLMSRSDIFLTEYRFSAAGHTYALSRALQASVVRDLIFIDDLLACVLAEQQGDERDVEDFWWRRDSAHPVYKWEWANEPGGLEYLAAMLREACGLGPIRERRQLEHDWSNRTMTGTEIAVSVAHVAALLPPGALFFLVPDPTILVDEDAVRARRSFEQRDRRQVDQQIWSLPLGGPQEQLAAFVGVPDVQYLWPRTGTTVNAYQLGSVNRFFVGTVDGRAVWVHADYPGLILQAKLAVESVMRGRK